MTTHLSLKIVDEAEWRIKRQALANGSGRVPNATLRSRMVGTTEFEIYPIDAASPLPYNWAELAYHAVIAQCNWRGIVAPERVTDRSRYVFPRRLKLRSILARDENPQLSELRAAIKMATHYAGNSFSVPSVKVRRLGGRTLVSTGLKADMNRNSLVLSNADMVQGVHAEHFTLYRPKSKGSRQTLGFTIDCTRLNGSAHAVDLCQHHAERILSILWIAR